MRTFVLAAGLTAAAPSDRHGLHRKAPSGGERSRMNERHQIPVADGDHKAGDYARVRWVDSDPIRARLDQIQAVDSAKPDFILTMGTNYRQMLLALRAVLDLLGEPVQYAHYEDPLSVREDEIRRTIADALDVQP